MMMPMVANPARTPCTASPRQPPRGLRPFESHLNSTRRGPSLPAVTGGHVNGAFPRLLADLKKRTPPEVLHDPHHCRITSATRSSVQPRGRGTATVRLAGNLLWLPRPEPVEDLAGVRLDEGVRVRLVRGDVNAVGVEVVEVDPTNDVLGDPGGERDGDPVPLAMHGVPRALAAQMGGVREVTPRHVSVPLPLTEEEVAVVVADLDDVGVHHRHLGDVWRVDDHLTAVGDDRFELVEALGRGPDVL